MILSNLDWTIVVIYFLFVLAVGLYVSRQSKGNVADYFLSGRNMAWWLLGVSMVATTFSADTPNLVTDLVRKDGVAGNWAWWAFLLTGMLTVFVYAKLWRRSMVLTDIEFYELRYSGKAAAFLRAFRAVYLGLIFNVLVMGAVSLAAIKFGEIVLGMPGWQTLLIAGTITLLYSTLGGLKAVIITDFVQFFLAMIGSIWACIYIVNLPEVGGLTNLLTHENVIDKTAMLPSFDNPSVWVPVLLVPLAVQWWASYYPGSEPGGGGYIAQRMFSAKDEKNAVGATLLFNIAHYALRPWPWILIALASLVVFPELSDIQEVFPNLSEDKVGHDIAYPAMLTKLPSGLLGLVAASLIAAFMSTMSTQLNLGASYLVNDLYQRFIKPEASQKEMVKFSRIMVIIITVLAVLVASQMDSISGAWKFFINAASGLGVAQLIRWFWWRANAWTEISSMVAALIATAFYPVLFSEYAAIPHFDTYALVGITFFSLAISIIVTLRTKAVDEEQLQKFIDLCNPIGLWKGTGASKGAMKGFFMSTVMWVLGLTASFSGLFTIGYFLMLKPELGALNLVISLVSFVVLNRMIKKENQKGLNNQ